MTQNIITVPNLAAVDLTALVKRELKLGYIDEDYEKWDYYIDLEGRSIPGRGFKFEFLIWEPELKPDEVISSDVVRKHYHDLGFFGHAGAFTQWRRTCGLEGHHVSILEEGACWRVSTIGLCTPCSRFIGGSRELRRAWVCDGWNGDWSFVGFKPLDD